MELIEFGELELTYTAVELVDYGSDGQIYGTMEGTVAGDRINAQLRLTNLAARRPDNVNLPTLRGVMTTDDGAAVWVEIDGVATLRASDNARVFVTAFRCRTGDGRYAWLNTMVGVLEGVLTSVGLNSTARGSIFECRATVE